MKISTKMSSGILLMILLFTVVASQANAKLHKKPIKSKKAIETCVSKWTKAYHSELGLEDHPINYDQIQEWEDWCRKGRTPQNYKYKG